MCRQASHLPLSGSGLATALTLALAMLLPSGRAGADNPTVIPPPTPLTVGVEVVLQVVVPETEPPFRFRPGDNPSAEVQIRQADSLPFIDEQGKRSRIVRLELIPLAAGELKLPPLRFQSGNRALDTEPISLAVELPELDENMVLALDSSHRRAFVGQPVEVRGIWRPGYSLERIAAVDLQLPLMRRPDIRVDLPPESAFRQDDVIGLPVSNRRIPARVDSGLLEFSMVIQAVEPGELTFEPARMLASIVDRQSPSPRSGFQYPAAFDNQFFRAPGDVVARRVFATSNKLRLSVSPLPEGAPPSFTGVVGAFEARAIVSPSDLKAGGLAELTVTLTDHPHPRALLDALPNPARNPALTRRFTFPADQPTARFNDGAVEFRIALRPRSVEVDQVPSIPLSYFDPVDEVYVEIQTESLPLRVQAGTRTAEARLQDGRRLATSLRTTSPGVAENTPWKELVSAPGWHERLVAGDGGVRWILLLLPVAWFGWTWGRRQRFDQLPWARRRRIWRAFERSCRRATAADDPGQAIDRLRLAWNDFLVRRFGFPPARAADPSSLEAWLQRQARHPADDREDDLSALGRELHCFWSELDRQRYKAAPAATPAGSAEPDQPEQASQTLQALARRLHHSFIPLP